MKHVSFERMLGVTGVEVKGGVAHCFVTLRSDDQPEEGTRGAFAVMAAAGIPIFLIQLHTRAVSFAVEASRVPDVQAALGGAGLDCAVKPDVAVVGVIASSMRELPGVLVGIADALQEAGARVYGYGDSHNSVQCLIDGEHVASAVSLLNARFGLEDESA